MLTYNRIVVLGIVGDVSMKQTGGGQTVVTVSVATHRKEKGEYVTDWFTVVLFDPHESIQQVVPGDVFSVDGTIRVRSYTDREQIKRKAFDIIADRWSTVAVPRKAKDTQDTTEPKTSKS